MLKPGSRTSNGESYCCCGCDTEFESMKSKIELKIRLTPRDNHVTLRIR